jgi:sugar transferase (PEP-CTERM/EpsH1 system associated)
MLRYLSERYRVHLGSFVDEVGDLSHQHAIQKFCDELLVEEIRPSLARLGSLRGIVTGDALSLPYYANSRMSEWVQRIIADRRISAVVVYSSPMAQYVTGPRFRGIRRIMDFVDVDSDKWRQYAETRSGISRWVYRRESDKLLQFERKIASEFDAITVVSSNERTLLDSLSANTAGRHHVLRNGVDTAYFDADAKFECPFNDDAEPIVFTGMMDYWPNVDAVTWFAQKVFPLIRARRPSSEFWIVGASPTRAVSSLSAIDGVHVTGRVPDVRPYLRHSGVTVAPLRVARGVQNKVLEALAMGCRAVCSKEALAGLEESSDMPAICAASEAEYVEAVVSQLALSGNGRRRAGPEYIRQYYNWDRNLELLDTLLDSGS